MEGHGFRWRALLCTLLILAAFLRISASQSVEVMERIEMEQEIQHETRRGLVANCNKCVNPGAAGLSRCFLCQAFKQSKGSYYKSKKCKSAFCAYLAKITYPKAKRIV